MAQSLNDYFRVSREHLVAGRALDCDLYLYMATNKSIVRYLLKGDALSADKCAALQNAATTIPLVLKSDLKSVMSHNGQKIETALKTDANLGSSEVVGAAAGILRNIDSTLSTPDGDSIFKTANASTIEMLSSAQSTVEEILKQVGSLPATLIFDQVLAKIKLSSQNPLAQHNQQVSTLCVLMLLTEGNATKTDLADIAAAGMLHDIGLEKMPKTIVEKYLNGQEDFNNAENLVYMKHPEEGMETIAKSFPDISSTILKIIECHHENFDGSGFKRKKGNFIPRLSRFLRIADNIAVTLNSAKTPITFKDALSESMQTNLFKYDLQIIKTIHDQYLGLGQEI